ncbi:MAG: hypothetical protein U5J82_04605 [Desulfobacterales bacterium]|nr:hypothetical protein [Desulfobacterales bacterium]
MTARFIKPLGWMLAAALPLLLAAGPAAAGGIINKQNQSADYLRTLGRNAATDYADIAVYNPAGIMQMADGLYGKLDVMYFGKDYSNDVPGFGTLDQDEPSIIPGVFTIYKRDRWAGFFAFTVPAGGGELDYKDGNARTIALASGVAAGANARLAAVGAPTSVFYDQIDPGEIEVKQSTVLGFTLGVSYALSDAWSVAVGTRYSRGVREFDGEASISATNPLVLGGVQLNPDPDAEPQPRTGGRRLGRHRGGQFHPQRHVQHRPDLHLQHQDGLRYGRQPRHRAARRVELGGGNRVPRRLQPPHRHPGPAGLRRLLPLSAGAQGRSQLHLLF